MTDHPRRPGSRTPGFLSSWCPTAAAASGPGTIGAASRRIGGTPSCSAPRPRPGTTWTTWRKKGSPTSGPGEDRVNLRAALEELHARYGVKRIRVDSGGTLNGILLRAGLVDEVSLLIHPAMVGGLTERSVFRAPDPVSPDDALPLRLVHLEQLAGDLVWLRYEVVK